MKKLTCLVAVVCVTGMLSVQQTVAQDKKVITYKGKITTFEKSDPTITSVMIKTDTDEIKAELAPLTFIEEQKLVLNPNDEIVIKGFEETRDGRRVFVVTELTDKDQKVIRLRSEDMTPVWTKTTKTTTTTTTQGGEKVVVKTGKVTTYERSSEPAVVRIKTDVDELQAELAPITFLEEQKISFNPNDDVTVKGFEQMRDGKRVFVVTEVTTKDRKAIRLRGEDLKPVWTKVTTTSVKRRETTDLTGEVTVLETTETSDGRLVRIKSDSGERVVALAPGVYLEKHKYEFKPGEKIVIKGFENERDGKKVFVAVEARRGDTVFKFRREDGTPLWDE